MMYMVVVMLGVTQALGQEYDSPSRWEQSNSAATASSRGRCSQRVAEVAHQVQLQGPNNLQPMIV